MDVPDSEHMVALCGSQPDGSRTELVERVERLGAELVDDAGVESYPQTTTSCTVLTAD